jgi:hypothetical protein
LKRQTYDSRGVLDVVKLMSKAFAEQGGQQVRIKIVEKSIFCRKKRVRQIPGLCSRATKSPKTPGKTC